MEEVGAVDGLVVGSALGLLVNVNVGSVEGLAVRITEEGTTDLLKVGQVDGILELVGWPDGSTEGDTEDGQNEGFPVGVLDGVGKVDG